MKKKKTFAVSRDNVKKNFFTLIDYILLLFEYNCTNLKHLFLNSIFVIGKIIEFSMIAIVMHNYRGYVAAT